jgi:hypothetical protein
MSEPKWMPLTVNNPIKAKPDSGVWQQACSYFLQGPALIKIEATGQWNYSRDFVPNPCSADGDVFSPFDSKRCIHENSPVGALIGRIGGSIADKDATSVFCVGSVCVRKLDKDTKGPLFLTINDMRTGFDDNSGDLTVNILYAELPE